MLVPIIAVGLLLAGPSGAPLPQEYILIHVGIPARDGFVDASKGVADSVRDIRSRLASIPGVWLNGKQEDADLYLWVVDRGVGSEAYGSRATVTPYFQGALLQETKMYANTYWVAAILEAGEYRKEMIGDYTHGLRASFGAWTEAAKELAKDLEVWISANRTRLLERRRPVAPAAAPAAPTTAWALALAQPEATWTTTLPGTTARVTPLADGSVRLVLEGAQSLSALLVPDGPGRFVGVADTTPPCAVMAPEVSLIDEGGAWTGRAAFYDCTTIPPKAHRTAFRVMR